jgi:hypothetical protein
LYKASDNLGLTSGAFVASEAQIPIPQPFGNATTTQSRLETGADCMVSTADGEWLANCDRMYIPGRPVYCAGTQVPISAGAYALIPCP